MLSFMNTRPVWALINLDNLIHNINEIRKNVSKDTMISGVIKADGYGHGAIMIARTILANGIDRLAVATLSEAIELRKNNIKAPILILGYTPGFQANDIISNNITQTIFSYEQAEALSYAAESLGKEAVVHIKIDTGMSRLGFDNNKESINTILKISKLTSVRIEGIFSHFALADAEDQSFTKKQYERFDEIVKQLEIEGLEIPIKHISNSAAIINNPECDYDMVRAGLLMYGLYPSEYVNHNRMNLKPVMSLKANISQVRNLEKGVGISYGHSFITEMNSKIGTIPIGYADGYSRLLSNKIYVGVNGKQVKVIGNICMDQCMLDLTGVKDIGMGDEVYLFGDGTHGEPSVDEIAAVLGTINYEIICILSKRVPRAYIKNNEVIHIRDYLLE